MGNQKAHVFSAGISGKDGKCEACGLVYGAECHAFYSYLEPVCVVCGNRAKALEFGFKTCAGCTTESDRAERQAILDSLIGTQDALEAIREHVSMGDYIAMHKTAKQQDAESHYLAASDRIARCGTVRKALNDVQFKIETYR